MEIDQRILLFLEKVSNSLLTKDKELTDSEKLALFAGLMEQCQLRFITYIEDKKDA